VKISLLENSLDSLKKGFEHLNNYEEMHLLDNKGNERFLVLKDAVLAIHHGIEILFKEALNRSNEILVFTEIDKRLKTAFVIKRQRNLDSLFEADPTLNTVTFQEAVDRVHKICGHKINESFIQKLDKLQIYRNQITHSEVSIDEIELNSVFEGLVDDIDIFFTGTIGEDYSTITGYSALKKNYEKYLQNLKKAKREIKKSAVEKFLEAFKKCSISMGENEVKTISDINLVTKLITTLYSSELRFGTDLYNGYCSGNVTVIKRLDNGRFSLFTEDNNAEYIFKFKNLLIFMPKVEEDFSPILFFEADNDNIDSSLEKYIEFDKYTERKSISGVYFYDQDKIEWNSEKLNEFYLQSEYDEYFVTPKHHRVEHFLSSGVFCFINVQMLSYGQMGKVLRDFGTTSLKQIEVAFKRSLKNNV
jgi:uncharacterized protein YutE (UPF0331/DUF86 family)